MSQPRPPLLQSSVGLRPYPGSAAVAVARTSSNRDLIARLQVSQQTPLAPRHLGPQIVQQAAPRTREQEQFKSKVVQHLSCGHCHAQVCRRGMKAILLADTQVELFSTDAPPNGYACVGLSLFMT